jgi:hypothetical protein
VIILLKVASKVAVVVDWTLQDNILIESFDTFFDPVIIVSKVPKFAR